MPNYAFSVAQTEILIGLEAARGTAAADQSAMPVRSPKYKPDLTLIPDQTLQGSMVETYDLIPGLRYDSHGWDSYPYLDTFPLLVGPTLGSADTKTAAPTSTTLSAAATAGATSMTLTANSGTGYATVDTGGLLETVNITAVTGSAPFTATLANPLVFSHASGVAVTGLTSHKWSLLNNSASTGNEPISCTITDFDGDQWRQLTASQIGKLTLKGNATGLVDYTCDWFANPSVTPSAPSPSYSSVPAVPGWTARISVGGTLLNYVEDWELDLARSTKPIPAITGTQNYFEYFADTIAVTGKITVIEQTGGPQFVQYLAGSKESIDITLFDLSSGFALNLHGSSAMWKTGELQRGAKGEVKAAFDLELLPNTTDATSGGKSPIAVTVANNTTTAYAGS